ncbi:hypothetical protein D3C71_2135310 [compost metagenome]
MKNSGSEIAASEITLMILSGIRSRKWTDNMPRQIARGTAMMAAKPARNSELPSLLPTCSETEFRLAHEVPKSPCTTPPSQSK